ncbi:hypothetical protein [Kibdelosporangium philippinense]|uniref:hypothetical protein n=1 Tax=Kibdelosporangium philippinense TaxID=211113 RepID=UPI003619B59D
MTSRAPVITMSVMRGSAAMNGPHCLRWERQANSAGPCRQAYGRGRVTGIADAHLCPA